MLAEAERTAPAETLTQRSPVTDAEVAEYAGPRPDDEPRPEPGAWVAARAAQTEGVRADREAEAADMGRLVPVTDAEAAAAAAEPRDYPAPDPGEAARLRQEQTAQLAHDRERERTIGSETEPEPTHVDPVAWAGWKAEQTEQADADRQARHEAAARETPVTEAEVARYGGAQPEPEIRVEAETIEAGQESAPAAAMPEPSPASEARTETDAAKGSEPEAQPEADAGAIEAEVNEETAELVEVDQAEVPREQESVVPEPSRKAEAHPESEAEPEQKAEEPQRAAEPEPAPESAAAKSAQERSEALAGLREDVGALRAKVDVLARQDAERAAERAEITQAAIDEPSVREPQAEPSLEASWQPGGAQGYYEAQAEQDAEPEMEL